jgi:hypothetical protein
MDARNKDYVLYNNPFPKPDTINIALNNEIKEYIKILVDNQELTRDKFVSIIMTCINKKNYEEAVIWSYYFTNVLEWKCDLTDEERKEYLTDLMTKLKTIEPHNYESTEAWIQRENKEFENMQ